MDKKALIDAILEKEWPMFHNVNGEERASCQNDYPVFEIMRRAQYDAWSPEALEAYLAGKVFAGAAGSTLAPDAEGVAGFKVYMERFERALAGEKAVCSKI